MSDLFPATDLDEFLSIRPHVRSHEHVAWGRFALRVPVNRLTGFVTILGPETVEVRKRVAHGSLVNTSVTLQTRGGVGGAVLHLVPREKGPCGLEGRVFWTPLERGTWGDRSGRGRESRWTAPPRAPEGRLWILREDAPARLRAGLRG